MTTWATPFEANHNNNNHPPHIPHPPSSSRPQASQQRRPRRPLPPLPPPPSFRPPEDPHRSTNSSSLWGSSPRPWSSDIKHVPLSTSSPTLLSRGKSGSKRNRLARGPAGPSSSSSSSSYHENDDDENENDHQNIDDDQEDPARYSSRYRRGQRPSLLLQDNALLRHHHHHHQDDDDEEQHHHHQDPLGTAHLSLHHHHQAFDDDEEGEAMGSPSRRTDPPSFSQGSGRPARLLRTAWDRWWNPARPQLPVQTAAPPPPREEEEEEGPEEEEEEEKPVRILSSVPDPTGTDPTSSSSSSSPWARKLIHELSTTGGDPKEPLEQGPEEFFETEPRPPKTRITRGGVVVLLLLLLLTLLLSVLMGGGIRYHATRGTSPEMAATVPSTAPSTPPPPPPKPSYDSCATALGPLPLMDIALPGSWAMISAQAEIPPPCLVRSNNNNNNTLNNLTSHTFSPQPGLWYHVVGTDQVVRASTCARDGAAATAPPAADTVLTVYKNDCAGRGRRPCVAYNDQFCGDQSSVSFWAASGVRYYILVSPSSSSFHVVNQTTTNNNTTTATSPPAQDFSLTVNFEQNGKCDNAIGPIPSDGTVVAGSLYGAQVGVLFTCSLQDAHYGQVWYKTVGTGQWMVASTCDAQTDFHARVDVIKANCSGECASIFGSFDSYCGNGYRKVWKSEVGLEYFILVYKAANIEGRRFGFSVANFEPAPNDHCPNAILLTVGGPMVMGSLWNSTYDDSVNSCSDRPSIQPGVWYTVQGTGGTLLASTCNNWTNFATELSIYTGSCNGTLTCVPAGEQFCTAKASVYWDSQAGEIYYVFVYGSDYGSIANVGEFGLVVEAFVTAENDACSAATTVELSNEAILGSTFAATLDRVSSCDPDSSRQAPGVWYKVVGKGSSLRASTCGAATSFDTQITIYSGNCNELQCVNTDDNYCGLQSSVTWVASEGEEYFVLVNGRLQSSVGNFALVIDTFVPVVANDFCDGAIFAMVNGAFIKGATLQATFDNAGTCVVPNTAPGVWYYTEGTGTTMVASLCTEQTTYNSAISVFSGNCTSLECVAGNDQGDNPFCGSHSEVSWFAQSSALYHILVHGYDVRVGYFGLKVFEPEPSVSNDFCISALSISASNVPILGRTGNATADSAPACDSLQQAGPGVWYTVTGTGDRLVASTCQSSSFDTRLSVYDGDCSNLQCVASDDNTCGKQSQVIWLAHSGTSYFILVHGIDQGAFNLTVNTYVPLQGNDECTGATNITVNGGGIQGSTQGATLDDVGYCGCQNTGPGVWFTIVGTGGRLQVDTCNDVTNFDTKLSVFSDDCDALLCVAGNDDGCGLQSSVTWPSVAGRTYWILLHGFGTSGAGIFLLNVTDWGA